MKKMFAASLVAIMAVSAANAEIASVSYTNKAITEKTGDINTLATTTKANLTAAVNELVGKVGTQDVGAQISTALESAKDYTDALANGAVKTNTDAIAALDDTYATDTALNDGLALKQDKAKMLNTLDGFSGSKAEYYPTIALMDEAIADANNEVGGSIEDLAETVSELSDTVSTNKSAADTGIQEAKDAAAAAKTQADKGVADAATAQAAADANTAAISAINNADTGILKQAQTYADQAEADAITAAGTAADSKITAALGDYSTTTAMNTAIKDANDAQTTAITTAYEAADAQTLADAKTYADEKAAAATGSATAVSEALEAYKTSNNTAVAAAKSAADAAQATADANATAISNLGETYATDDELNTAKSDIKTAYEAADATTLSDAKTYAKDYADGLAGNYATAAQGAKADSAVQQADVTTGTANGTIKVKGQDVSVAGLGTAAYTASTDYATAAQGTKADSAVQKADVTTGTANGTIKVKGQDVSVAGLGTAAYTASTDYATAAQGAKADTAMQVSELKDLASWSSAGCATGTCSLVSKSGEIQWEAVRYAE